MPYPYYVVWKGRTTGVFDNYDAVKESVSGVSDAKWKGCLSRLAAKEALRAGPPARSTKNMRPIQLTPPQPSAQPEEDGEGGRRGADPKKEKERATPTRDRPPNHPDVRDRGGRREKDHQGPSGKSGGDKEVFYLTERILGTPP